MSCSSSGVSGMGGKSQAVRKSVDIHAILRGRPLTRSPLPQSIPTFSSFLPFGCDWPPRFGRAAEHPFESLHVIQGTRAVRRAVACGRRPRLYPTDADPGAGQEVGAFE